jgi:predicted Zn-dependent protease
MAPLAQAMDYPRPPDQVKVAIMDDPHINAASAGGGEFYVTTGLLQKADDAHGVDILKRASGVDDAEHADLARPDRGHRRRRVLRDTPGNGRSHRSAP